MNNGRVANLRGKAGEDIAANYLKSKGYEIIARNFRSQEGEIDIVAAGEGYLVFVEVKLRKDDEFAAAVEAVDAVKIKKISQTASRYISKYRLFDANVRFDVVEIYMLDKTVNHIVDAFDSYLRY